VYGNGVQTGTVDDVVARKLDPDGTEDETTLQPEKEIKDVTKRSLDDDKIVFTRCGVYRMIESRLNA
jgi:hypothetical protein